MGNFVYATANGNWGDTSIWSIDTTEPYGDGSGYVAYNQVPQDGDTVFLNSKTIYLNCVTAQLAAIYPGTTENNSGSGSIIVENTTDPRTISANILRAGTTSLIRSNMVYPNLLTVNSKTGSGQGLFGGTGSNIRGIWNNGGQLKYYGNVTGGSGSASDGIYNSGNGVIYVYGNLDDDEYTEGKVKGGTGSSSCGINNDPNPNLDYITAYIYANIEGGSNSDAHGLRNDYASAEIHGDITTAGGNYSTAYGIYNNYAKITIYGNVYGPSSGTTTATIVVYGRSSVVNVIGDIICSANMSNATGITANGSTIEASSHICVIGNITGGGYQSYGIRITSSVRGIISICGTVTRLDLQPGNYGGYAVYATSGTVVYFQGTAINNAIVGGTLIQTNVIMPKQEGDWNSDSTWYGGTQPTSDSICVIHAFSIPITANITVDQIVGVGNGTLYCNTDNINITATTSFKNATLDNITKGLSQKQSFFTIRSDNVTIETAAISVGSSDGGYQLTSGINFYVTSPKKLTIKGIGSGLTSINSFSRTTIQNPTNGTIYITGSLIGGRYNWPADYPYYGYALDNYGTIYLTGNINGPTGSLPAYSVRNLGGNMYMTGNVSGGNTSYAALSNSGNITINGNVSGGTGYGMLSSGGSVSINGNITGGSASTHRGITISGGTLNVVGATSIISGDNSGYGIYISGGSPIINAMQTTTNGGGANSVGIYCSGTSSPVLNVGNVNAGSAANGYGINIVSSSTPTVTVYGAIAGSSNTVAIYLASSKAIYLNNIGSTTWKVTNSTYKAISSNSIFNISGANSKNFFHYPGNNGNNKFAYQLSSSRFKKGVQHGDILGTSKRQSRRPNNANIGSVMGSF